MRPDNTHHLLAAAQRRRDSTLERAQRTLRELSETDSALHGHRHRRPRPID